MRINDKKLGVILSYVHVFLSNIIAILYTPYALRTLGQSQYGLFGTAASFTSYLGLLSLGINGAYFRWYAKYRAAKDEEGERRLNGMYFTIFSIIAAVSLAIGMILVFVSPIVFRASFTDSELADLQVIVLLAVLNTALTFFVSPVMSYIQANEKFFFIRIVTIVAALISPFCNIVILLYGGKAVAIQKAALVLAALTFLAYYIYARKRLRMRFSFKGFQLQEFKEILLFSSFLLLNTLSNLLSDSTDGIVLGIVSGPIVVATYTVGRNIHNYFQQFSLLAASVFSPMVNRLVAEKENDTVLTQLMLRVARIQFYITSLVILGFTFLGKQFIYFWAGEGYEDAYAIGLLLMLATVVPYIQTVGLEIQKAKNKHQARTVVYFGVAIVNILLTIPFTIWWGAIGAVVATFLCCVFGQAIFMNVYYHKVIGLDMFYFWKGILKIVPSFIPTVVFGVLLNKFVNIDSLLKLLLAIIAICVIYGASVWFLSMNKYEKELIAGPVKKLFKKGTE